MDSSNPIDTSTFRELLRTSSTEQNGGRRPHKSLNTPIAYEVKESELPVLTDFSDSDSILNIERGKFLATNSENENSKLHRSDKNNGEEILYWEGNWFREGEKDAVGNSYPTPAQGSPWNGKLLIRKLLMLESKLNSLKRYHKHVIWKCPLCPNGKPVSDRTFQFKNMCWDRALRHQIEQHYWKPSSLFTDFILGSTLELLQNNKVALSGRLAPNDPHGQEPHSLVMTRNQWSILDTLMQAGGKKYWMDQQNKPRYSETAGYLTSVDDHISEITIGSSEESDPKDPSILFPNDMPQMAEHEYYFHTHPPTPFPGYRVKDGILYEFPSANDISHFLYQTTFGKTKGSIILAPEGVYILTRDPEKTTSEHLTDKQMQTYEHWMSKIEDKAMRHFKLTPNGEPPDLDIFYEEIASNHKYANLLHNKLQRWGIKMHYLSRIKNGDRWIIDGGRLPN
jgi:hypothetical protein